MRRIFPRARADQAPVTYPVIPEKTTRPREPLAYSSLAEVLHRLPTHNAAEGYQTLMPGILDLAAETTGGKKVPLF